MKIAGLDGLRAFAVLFVFMFHDGMFPAGWLGVQIFFVISGYLITRILIEDKSQPVGGYLKGFYSRRILRIFPLYYAYLIVILVGSEVITRLEMNEGVIFVAAPVQAKYAMAFVYNFFHASTSFVHNRLLAHFWSLSVEEQFYLAWPFFIYYTPTHLLRRCMVGIILAGPLLRLATYLFTEGAYLSWLVADPELVVYLAPWCHLDAFASGALISMVHIRRPRALAVGLIVFSLIAANVSTLWATGEWPPLGSFGFVLFMPGEWKAIWGYTLINLSSAATIYAVARRELLPKLFDGRALAYIGQISFGVYVYHFALQGIVHRALRPALPYLLVVLVDLAATIALASLSFHLYEKRFLLYKERFFSRRETKRGESTATVRDLV